MEKIKVVAVTGGTHGNEVTGVALARHLLRHPSFGKRPSFELKVMLTNLASIEKNVRYVEEDMNRCFFKADLADPTLTTLEARRAKEIDAALGPKSSASPVADLIIDLHNTTANTGVALMMPPKDELSHAIGAHLISKDAGVRVVNYTAGKADYPMLPTIGRHGMTFEVGAVSWGCVDGALFQQSLSLLGHLFDYVEAHNRAVEAGVSAAWQPRSLPVYDAARTVNYPRYDDGTIAATPHPAIQGQDFTVVRAGEPVFLTMEGEAVGFVPGEDESQDCYLFFINEAAYYEKGVAFMVAHRSEQEVRMVSVGGEDEGRSESPRAATGRAAKAQRR